MATFSERFRELRKEKGISQRELATALHMSNSAVAMYETGYPNSSPKNVDFISNSGIFSCSEIGKCSRNVAK